MKSIVSSKKQGMEDDVQGCTSVAVGRMPGATKAVEFIEKGGISGKDRDIRVVVKEIATKTRMSG